MDRDLRGETLSALADGDGAALPHTALCDIDDPLTVHLPHRKV
jgi:hypothetical protein